MESCNTAQLQNVVKLHNYRKLKLCTIIGSYNTAQLQKVIIIQKYRKLGYCTIIESYNTGTPRLQKIVSNTAQLYKNILQYMIVGRQSNSTSLRFLLYNNSSRILLQMLKVPNNDAVLMDQNTVFYKIKYKFIKKNFPKTFFIMDFFS